MTNIDAEKGEPAAPASGTTALEGLVQRLGALEESLTAIAGDPGAPAPAGTGRIDADAVRDAMRQATAPLREAVLRLEARLDQIEAAQRELTRQIAEYTAGPMAPPASAELIAGEVARQLEALIGDAAQSNPLPLLAGDDGAARDVVANPLVMGATERAIVRLTHRLEKLEEWRRRSGAARQRGGLIGRLFES